MGGRPAPRFPPSGSPPQFPVRPKLAASLFPASACFPSPVRPKLAASPFPLTFPLPVSPPGPSTTASVPTRTPTPTSPVPGRCRCATCSARRWTRSWRRTSSSGTTAWYLTDQLGSVRFIENTSGTVLDAITYDAFGNITSQSDSAYGDRFMFAGMQYDATTGLYYDHARYYDAAVGRFMSQDPKGFAAGDTNLYRYAGNEVTTLTDPSGLDDRFGGDWQTGIFLESPASGARWFLDVEWRRRRGMGECRRAGIQIQIVQEERFSGELNYGFPPNPWLPPSPPVEIPVEGVLQGVGNVAKGGVRIITWPVRRIQTKARTVVIRQRPRTLEHHCPRIRVIDCRCERLCIDQVSSSCLLIRDGFFPKSQRKNMHAKPLKLGRVPHFLRVLL